MLTDTTGPVELDVPRDRAATFEPQIVKKRQRPHRCARRWLQDGSRAPWRVSVHRLWGRSWHSAAVSVFTHVTSGAGASKRRVINVVLVLAGGRVKVPGVDHNSLGARIGDKNGNFFVIRFWLGERVIQSYVDGVDESLVSSRARRQPRGRCTDRTCWPSPSPPRRSRRRSPR